MIAHSGRPRPAWPAISVSHAMRQPLCGGEIVDDPLYCIANLRRGLTVMDTGIGARRAVPDASLGDEHDLAVQQSEDGSRIIG